jgi:hypothetical protein
VHIVFAIFVCVCHFYVTFDCYSRVYVCLLYRSKPFSEHALERVTNEAEGGEEEKAEGHM